jgi:hypothetical protein
MSISACKNETKTGVERICYALDEGHTLSDAEVNVLRTNRATKVGVAKGIKTIKGRSELVDLFPGDSCVERITQVSAERVDSHVLYKHKYRRLSPKNDASVIIAENDNDVRKKSTTELLKNFVDEHIDYISLIVAVILGILGFII